MNTYQFNQIIKERTNQDYTPKTQTLIDLAFTNKPEILNATSVIHLQSGAKIIERTA